MNSMFDRLGDFLRDYIDEDDQDIFSSPEEQLEKEKSSKKFSQDEKSNETKSHTNEKIKKEEKQENFSFTQNKSENKTEHKKKAIRIS